MNKKMLLIMLSAVLLLNGQSLFSQRNITLEDAISIGLKNNSELKQAKYDIDKAAAQVDEVFGNALPSLELTASFTHAIKKQIVPIDFESMLAQAVYGVLFKEELLPVDMSKLPSGTNYTSMQKNNTAQGQLQLTQLLFNSAVFTGIGISKEYVGVTKSQYNTKLADIVMNIKSAFYGVLYTRELLNIVNVSYANAMENLKNVTALSNQGLVSEFTLLDASVRVENIKPTIKQLENAVASATDGLKILLNIPQTDNINVSGEIVYQAEDLDDIERFVKQAKEHNLNINTLEKAVNINKASVGVSEADYYPTIAAFANYGYNAMSDGFSDWSTYPTSMVGLSFSMNLFKGMQTKYKVQQSKIDVLKAEEQIVYVKDAIAMQVKTNVNELIRIKGDIEAQQRNVNVATRAYELATTRFKEGTGNQLEIMNSDVALKQANTNLLESKYNYITSKIKLDNLLGNIPAAWLME